VLLAELEIRHTRANLPTRRVALGTRWLPVDPVPGFGGVLLGGVAASRVDELDGDELKDLLRLADDLEAGTRISQPRLRHRFQTDVVGLDRSRHKLVGDGELLWFELDDHGAPVPQLLGAVYAAGQVPAPARTPVFRVIRRALRWRGPLGPTFIAYLSSDEAARAWRTFPLDERWALQVLGFAPEGGLSRDGIQRRFRDLVRQVHPDTGAEADGAGQRILELTEARRILLQLQPE
jgi:hypothetical protein